MVLVYKHLPNWVIYKGKCWFLYSSTMVRIWVSYIPNLMAISIDDIRGDPPIGT